MTAKERRKFGRQGHSVILVDFRLSRSILYDIARKIDPGSKNRRRKKPVMQRLESSPFYQPLCGERHGSDIPVINKQVFMDQFDVINTCSDKKRGGHGRLRWSRRRSRDFSPYLKGVAVGLSSGTSGHRGESS